MPNVKMDLINAAWSAAATMENEAGRLEAQAASLRQKARELLRQLDSKEGE